MWIVKGCGVSSNEPIMQVVVCKGYVILLKD